VTHEYVIATGGVIFLADEEEPGPSPTAIAWAADRVLAVGSDDVVRAISRGDSTFIDLGGCVVTPLPTDPAPAERRVGEATAAGGSVDLIAALARADLFDPASRLEPGAAADLAFWRDEPAGPPRIVAIVHSGAFTVGDEHRGPFPGPRSG
jgi:hypothetical protein